MNRKAVRNSRSEKNEDFFQRKQLFNTKLLQLMNIKRWLKTKYLLLHSKIVSEKSSPEYIARGWALGMFCGCVIPLGLQLIVSIPASFILKGSKTGAIFGTLITNQLTIFIIYPIQCLVGSYIIANPLSFHKIKSDMTELFNDPSLSTLFSLSGDLTAAFFAGGLLLAAITTPLTYFGVLSIVREYHKIHELRKMKHQHSDKIQK
ncbi:MAG: DUF2062 domain-containing protein [Victivallaceae bacterium]|nr:DUF2062 domain-containing protein [Victivallaceae bacterium]